MEYHIRIAVTKSQKIRALVMGSRETVTLEATRVEGTGNLIGLEEVAQGCSISGALTLSCIGSGAQVGLTDETWPRVSLLFASASNFLYMYLCMYCTSVFVLVRHYEMHHNQVQSYIVHLSSIVNRMKPCLLVTS